MKKSLLDLAIVLRRTSNNPNTSGENRQLAKEALDAVRETIKDLDDPHLREKTTNRLFNVLGPTSKPSITQK